MGTNWGLYTTLIAIFSISLFMLGMEKKGKLTARDVSLIAALIALSAAGRAVTGVGLLFLQPTMFLVEITGFVYGAQMGFFVGAMTPLISNFFMGQGSWTPWQMICWGMVGVSGAVVRVLFSGAGSKPVQPKLNIGASKERGHTFRGGLSPTDGESTPSEMKRGIPTSISGGLRKLEVTLTALCFFWGYLYGAIMDIWQWSVFMCPLTFKTYLLTWGAGFGFDSLRAAGNLLFCAALGRQTLNILQYFRKKMVVQYLENL